MHFNSTRFVDYYDDDTDDDDDGGGGGGGGSDDGHDWGAGIGQWLERRTSDRKVAGSSPCMNFLLQSAFCVLADSYFGIRPTPVLPQQYVKYHGADGRLKHPTFGASNEVHDH